MYVLSTTVCAFAPSAGLLIGFRLLQGLSGAAGLVIARAVVRDLYGGIELARFLSNLTLVSGLAPILAPFIGGQVLRFTDWRGIFGVLAVIGAALTLAAWRWIPETLSPSLRHTGGPGEALRTMRSLLSDRRFSGYLLTGGFTFAALFGYLSASSFVIQDIHGASPQTYSLLFGLNSIGLVACGQLNGKFLIGRVGMDAILATGLGIIALAACALLLMASGALGRAGLVPVSAGLFVLVSALGLVLSNATALALTRAPHAAGTAAALLGTFSSLVGAVASPLVGIAGEHTAVPMALVQLTGVLLAGACFAGLCRPWRRTVDGRAAQ
jgi:DHA1 family bicyclomycin/chloramphenicol resistance-like MFS transporter